MGFRGCYQSAATPSRLPAGPTRRVEGGTAAARQHPAWEWGWDVPNEQVKPAGCLQTPLLFGSMAAGEHFTCLEEIYLRRTRLRHIYNLLSPGSRNNTAVLYVEVDHLLRPSATLLFLAVPRTRYPALSPRPRAASSPAPEGCRRAGAAVVRVGCAAQPPLRLFPDGASLHAGGQLRLRGQPRLKD